MNPTVKLTKQGVRDLDSGRKRRPVAVAVPAPEAEAIHAGGGDDSPNPPGLVDPEEASVTSVPTADVEVIDGNPLLASHPAVESPPP